MEVNIAPLFVSAEDHINYGNVLRNCRGAILDLIEKSIPDTVHHAQARQCLIKLDRLRTELEIQLHSLVPPNRDPRHLRTSVYSGLKPLTRKLPARDEQTRDAFAHWDVEY